jgi:hypothetical protein
VKAKGNNLFGAGQYEEALSQYEMALQIAAELESAEDVCSACYSNRVVCFLKLVSLFSDCTTSNYHICCLYNSILLSKCSTSICSSVYYTVMLPSYSPLDSQILGYTLLSTYKELVFTCVNLLIITVCFNC